MGLCRWGVRPPCQVVRGLQVGRIVHHTGRHSDVRHVRINAHRVLIEDIDALNGVYGATVPVGANSGSLMRRMLSFTASASTSRPL